MARQPMLTSARLGRRTTRFFCQAVDNTVPALKGPAGFFVALIGQTDGFEECAGHQFQESDGVVRCGGWFEGRDVPSVWVSLMQAMEQVDAVTGHGHHVGIDAVERRVTFGEMGSVAGAFGFAVPLYEIVAGGGEIIRVNGGNGTPQVGHISRWIVGVQMASEFDGDAEGKIQGGDARSGHGCQQVEQVTAAGGLGAVEQEDAVGLQPGLGYPSVAVFFGAAEIDADYGGHGCALRVA